MSERILAFLVQFITHVIDMGGYAGIAALMAIESACIPLPSEIIMPFAGYLVYLGRFNLYWAATAGAIGCNLGSVIAYWIGAKGGRPLVERYGRLGPDEPSRPRSYDVLLSEIRFDYCPCGATHADSPDIHRIPGGHCEDAAAPLSHLHLYWLVAMVFRDCLRGHEAGRKMAH